MRRFNGNAFINGLRKIRDAITGFLSNALRSVRKHSHPSNKASVYITNRRHSNSVSRFFNQVWLVLLIVLKDIIRAIVFIVRFFKIINRASVNQYPSRFRAKKSFLKPESKPPSFILSVIFTVMKLIMISILIVSIAGVGVFIGIAKAYVDTTPSLDWAKIDSQAQTSFIYDKDGNLLTRFYGTQNRIMVNLEDIPKMLQDAFISIEDIRFYKHNGVDFKRFIGAIVNNLSSDSLQGGSTITQQLIKNTILSFERTYKRKIQEMYLAIQLEKQYSKEEILEAYLNTIYMGDNNYGVKAAARDYFGKEDLNTLTLKECAMLAGLTQNPYRYHPRYNYYIRNTPEVSDNRANLVLYEMYSNGYIDYEQYQAAKNETLNVKEQPPASQNADMPYFSDYLITEVINELLDYYGMENTPENRTKIDFELRTKGYRIYSTVDPKVQRAIEETLYNWQNYPDVAVSTDKYVSTTGPGGVKVNIIQPQAAAVVIDHATGEIRGMVGGRSDPQFKREFNRAYQSIMPIGSSIKPLSVYTPAFDKGFSPASIRYDVPAPIPGWDTEEGFPKNYSPGYEGAVTLRRAVIRSTNIIAAQTLLNDVTLDTAYEYLLKLGIDPSHINKDGSGMALGTSGITPLELAAGYATIANKGYYRPPIAFTKITDSSGRTIIDMKEKQNQNSVQVYDPGSCWLMVDVMKDSAPANARLDNIITAGKTGTNSEFRGNSFAGMTGYYATAIWIGHDRFKPLAANSTGSRSAAPLFKAYMTKIHEGLPNRDIIEDSPEDLGLVKKTFCAISGELAGPNCPKTNTDYILSTKVPRTTCSVHRNIPYCEETQQIATPYCPQNHVQWRKITAIPQNSYLYNIPDDVLRQYIASEFTRDYLPDDNTIRNITSDHPDYRYFCTMHTKEWYDSTYQLENLLRESNELLAKSDELFSDMLVKGYLKPDEIVEFTRLIEQLEILIEENAEIENIRSAYIELNSFYNKAYKIWEAYEAMPKPSTTPTPNPTPTVSSEPTESPTHSPTPSSTPTVTPTDTPSTPTPKPAPT